MNAEILAVGTELLMGQIANTNAQYLSQQLAGIGINVYYHSVVGDNADRLKACLNQSLSRSKVVITTGGLGPTQDDITKEVIAQYLGLKLIYDDETLDDIKNFFKRTGRHLIESNFKQALIPEGAIIIKNSNGTAPGAIIEHNNRIIIILPGPPSEMKPMILETVLPYLNSKSGFNIVSRYIKIFGVGESKVENMLLALVNKQTNPTLATYANDGEVTLRLTCRCNDDASGTRLLDEMEDEVNMILGNSVYSNENKTMEEVVGQLLLTNNISVSVAESCTGGMLACRLTRISGISEVFKMAVVTYSDDAKSELINVKKDTLDKFGAVSSETAMEMAQGIREKSGSQIGISITGIAGPTGGSDEKPVGTVYIAISDGLSDTCTQHRFFGNREKVRNLSVLYALDMIRQYIINLNLER
jgi:nicotinamide-nucleotide amidase